MKLWSKARLGSGIAFAAAAVLGGASLVPSFAEAQQSDAADAGKTKFEENCAACHGANLQGSGGLPALVGEEFKTRWQGKPTELFTLVKETMPPPGMELPDADYHVIVGYILQQNGLAVPAPAATPAPAAAGAPPGASPTAAPTPAHSDAPEYP